ncbi:PR domain zinc finger protein 14 [Nasonia vitripennis]|uniref:C2H2-type domain-containing protein n=1 Tax=Nasonia vitripennis TaxID=7425 RepID=A0A7M7QIC0_NASVI|nr:PR domain zinc finger protein 14 [Nasonia vitripennis]
MVDDDTDNQFYALCVARSTLRKVIRKQSFYCPKCPAVYDYKTILNHHMKHECVKTKRSKKLTCPDDEPRNVVEFSVVHVEDILSRASTSQAYTPAHSSASGKFDRVRRGRPPVNSAHKYLCPRCPSSFTYLRGLNQHLRYACYQRPRFQCPYCQHVSKYRYAAYNHVRQCHKNEEVYCIDLKAQEQ